MLDLNSTNNNKVTNNEVITEHSAMAVVFCQDKILATNELIYANEVLSLPKGHVEKDETVVETAIRECFEETNVALTEANFVKQLDSFVYEFLTPSNKTIRKTLTPCLFLADSFATPTPKEARILSVQWLQIEEFLSKCPYDNVKSVVKTALKCAS